MAMMIRAATLPGLVGLCVANIAALPEGPGLSASHPHDAGMASDPAVLLAENFETGALSDLGKRWDDVSNEKRAIFEFNTDQPLASGGKRSLQMTARLGENTGGHLYKKLPREVDTAFARFYVKFAADAEYVHHFVHLGGYRPATTWPQGGAGERPRGDERFSVGIEPHGNHGKFPPPGAWNFYAYWPEMKLSADGKYWGNAIPAPAIPRQDGFGERTLVPRDRWQCVEIMLKCNSAPDERDGELALWLDGKLLSYITRGTARGPWTGLGFEPLELGSGGSSAGEPFEGFRWRTNLDLKVNFFWLLFYVTENAARQNNVASPNPVNRVWFDDIVVATAYIGPIFQGKEN
jgi:hypothetical protein